MATMQLGALVSASRAWLQRSQMMLSSARTKQWTAAALGGCLAELSGRSAAPCLRLLLAWCIRCSSRVSRLRGFRRTKTGFSLRMLLMGGLTFRRYRLFALLPSSNDLLPLNNSCVLVLFGLVVADLEECVDLPLAVQTRLAEQALAQNTLVLCLTVKTDQQPSLGSLVTVRAQARRIRHGDGRFVCQVHALKKQTLWAGWVDEEWCCGPTGVR
ncbi:MAG: hypothetical protein Ct9H300mP25_12210 [Acidobacteriota bacterium]|nr:MAG: hypothetical protein Ct9H300mP25_12210 [Acidobacteriota bacterium]